jgi:SIR2-like domain/NACHT domain
VNVEELIARLSAGSERVLPFVGSGMMIAAGAPSSQTLAKELARRAGIAADEDLTAVSAAAERAIGPRRTREILAEVITGLRLHSTPALTALCGVPDGRVLTTNYDDGIERSAIGRGLEPLPLAPSDPRILDTPRASELQVVHLHGMAGDPGSLVLPGSSTNDLVADEVFKRFISATLAHCHVLYLGFSLGLAELHLREILAWLAAAVSGVPDHYLLLSAKEVDERGADMGVLISFDFLKVVSYDPEPDHVAVERVAVALAPRAGSEGREERGGRTEPTWVHPILVRAESGDDREAMQTRVAWFDGGWGRAETIASPEDLLAAPRTIVIAGPGMGKTTLLRYLPSMAAGRTCARGALRDFSPARQGTAPESAVARLLCRVDDGEPVAIEDLRGSDALLLLDGLDEVDKDVCEDAVVAIASAASAWPDHCWVVSSRPCGVACALAAEGFVRFHILPSRRWARIYLETRCVPADRLEQAMLDGHGLGDLLGVPLFAERLADRLLEGVASSLSPLGLLVDEQYAATAREARRHGEERADLSGWLRSLAVALELRGRASAQTAELAAVVGPGGLAAEEARNRLADVALLADVPGSSVFPLRTMQEGLCADAILRAEDPVAALCYAASAEVAGVEWLRDDIEFTIDLVFEHADRDLREALKEIDPMRWARTVVTTGDLVHAREAFGTIWDRYVERGVSLVYSDDERGLRTSKQAIRMIARRWPEAIVERRDELEDQARSGTSIDRERALVVLGELPFDRNTEGWLLPRLEDSDPHVVMLAAKIAGRLHLASAEPSLRKLFASCEEYMAGTILTALVEIVDVPMLAEIGAKAAGHHEMLNRIVDRLLERVDLDTGIELVARAGHMDGGLSWFMQRLIETAHPGAWTAPRIAALSRACSHEHVNALPDVETIAGIFAKCPTEAISEVFLRRIGEGGEDVYGPPGQLLPLSRLDPTLLSGDEHAELREAVEYALCKVDEYKERFERFERALERLRTQLDTRGEALEPGDLDLRYCFLYKLEPSYRDLLSELLSRWWPEGGLVTDSGAQELDEQTRTILKIGAEIRPPIERVRWRELLQTHLVTQQWTERFESELARGVIAWLLATYREEYEGEIAMRIPAADFRSLATLLTIPGREGRSRRLIDLAFERLRQLDRENAAWISVVAMLVEDGHHDRARALLAGDLREAAREAILALLARHGEAAAQIQLLEGFAQAFERGESPQRPAWADRTWWHDREPEPAVVAASARLADVALAHDSEDVITSFALSVIQGRPDEEALALLNDLATRHRATQPWLQLNLERFARRIATREVLHRLPEALDGVAAEFTAKAEKTAPT